MNSSEIRRQRGIRIPLSYQSWERVCKALGYAVGGKDEPEDPLFAAERELLSDTLRYIKKKLQKEAE